jgi:hypothetical protein
MKPRISQPFQLSIGRAARTLCVVAGLVPATIEAQSSIGEMRRQATRAELEQAAKAAEAASAQAPSDRVREKLQSDAAALRNRLTNGDFVPGDRILLMVPGDSVLSDTFTVRGDRKLQLANVTEVSLHGVLDSELEPYLTKELSRYIKQVTLEATPLVRISLLGFPQSTFFTVPVDQSITDVISAAGGFGSGVPDKMVVRRAGEVILDAKATAEAIRQGKTVGDMSMRDGDELYMPSNASTGGLASNWRAVVGALGSITSIIWIIRRTSN